MFLSGHVTLDMSNNVGISDCPAWPAVTYHPCLSVRHMLHKSLPGCGQACSLLHTVSPLHTFGLLHTFDFFVCAMQVASKAPRMPPGLDRQGSLGLAAGAAGLSQASVTALQQQHQTSLPPLPASFAGFTRPGASLQQQQQRPAAAATKGVSRLQAALASLGGNGGCSGSGSGGARPGTGVAEPGTGPDAHLRTLGLPPLQQGPSATSTWPSGPLSPNPGASGLASGAAGCETADAGEGPASGRSCVDPDATQRLTVRSVFANPSAAHHVAAAATEGSQPGQAGHRASAEAACTSAAEGGALGSGRSGRMSPPAPREPSAAAAAAAAAGSPSAQRVQEAAAADEGGAVSLDACSPTHAMAANAIGSVGE